MARQNGTMEYWNTGMMRIGGGARHPLFHHSNIPAFSSSRGSALILAVVLTSLLAIVGVLFVMAAQLDKMATSATTDNRTLGFAVDAVLGEISDELVQDVPGVGPNQEYYDFPDANNPWLAGAEVYPKPAGASGVRNDYCWRQITRLWAPAGTSDRDLRARVVGEREPINLNDPNKNIDANADADGDGVSDARWVRVPGLMSGKGQPVYAAVRIIDNGGMLNVNTGYKFDPAEAEPNKVDGSSQLQVNVLALGNLPGVAPAAADDGRLLAARAVNKTAASDLRAYERQVLWKYPGDTDSNQYVPFDLSDELELRYRYLLNGTDIDSRLEMWGGRFRPASVLRAPVDTRTQLDAWYRRVALSTAPADVNSYAYRTVATTYNMDRILMPQELTLEGGARLRKMVNVNGKDQAALEAAVTAALQEANPGVPVRTNDVLQITANLMDYLDDDDEVTTIWGGSSAYHGFERPCVYLSEIAYRQVKDPYTAALYTSCAIELYKPYVEDRDPKSDEWQVRIDNVPVPGVLTWSGTRRFHVLLTQDPQASLTDYVKFTDPNEEKLADTMPRYGYNRSDYQGLPQTVAGMVVRSGSTVSLWRKEAGAEGKWFMVDFKRVPDDWVKPDGVARSLQRDISLNKCIRRLWSPDAQPATPGLGNANLNYVAPRQPGALEILQAHPANGKFTNIGELGLVFATNAYAVTEQTPIADCLIDLQSPKYRRLLNYLTVIDPSVSRSGSAPDETRIKGRININTAPPFVLAQLPWMQYEDSGLFQRAAAIAANRAAAGPFQCTSELLRIPEMRTLMADGKDNQHADDPRGPDLTPDTARDDLEERDLVFTRISNLVTVRSDVFTAYLLVRIGTSGPQKRVVAILDRSQVNSPRDRARLVALYPVPDPR